MLDEVTFKGNPLTLVGRSIKEGFPAPDFKVVSGDLEEKALADFSGKIKVITFFPSLDTPVCDLQLKEFNKKSAGLSPEVTVIGISKDLPFAQQRFCETFEIKNVKVLSDYKTSSFGINYGLLIKELNLLARGAVILDKNNILRYKQVVQELTSSPDYAAVLKAMGSVIQNPALPIAGTLPSKCKPCETGTLSLPIEKINKLIAQYRGWELQEEKKLVKEFKFKDFAEAKYFLDLIAIIAQEQGHHPNLNLGYAKLKVTLITHAAGGLTENDFIMAKIIDELNA
jgi:thiol peroxidase